MEDIQIPEPPENQIKEYLRTSWREHLLMMYDPPFWIVEYAAWLWESEGEGGWKEVQGKKGKGKEQTRLMSRTFYGLWKRGLDIAFIQPLQSQIERRQTKEQGVRNIFPGVMSVPQVQREQDVYHKELEFFHDLGFTDSIPPVPTGNRPFIQLQDSPDVWEMSLDERKRLAEHWEEEMRRVAYHNYLDKYKWLRNRYEEACERYDAVCDEVSVCSFSFFEYHPLTFSTEETSFVAKCRFDRMHDNR